MGRVNFPSAKQSEWFEELIKQKGVTINDIAKIGKVSARTARDWKREKYKVPEKALLQIARRYKFGIPRKIKILPDYWYVTKGARIGALKRMELYGPLGTPRGRKKGGKISQLRRKLHPELYPNCILEKKFITPPKSIKLAELVGVILGDGGVTRNQLRITLNKETEPEYIKYVCSLIELLFKEKPRKYYFKSSRHGKTCNIAISGVNLVKILMKLGIKKGNKIKQQVSVPKWIVDNLKYSRVCLRGLIDTDGCLYFHKHYSHGCECFNLGLTFTSHSRPLLEFAQLTLLKNNFNSKLKEKSVFLYRIDEIKRYIDIIGSSNKHHTDKFKEFCLLKMRRSTQVVDGARLESV